MHCAAFAMLRGMILDLELVGGRGLRPPAAEQLVDRQAPRTVFRFPSTEDVNLEHQQNTIDY